MREPRLCAVDGCGPADRLVRGWCIKHWRRWRTHGDPHHVELIRGDDLARFESYVDSTAEGCHVWTGKRSSKGYGQFRLNGRHERSHRAAWKLKVGEIPSGMVVMHRCDNPPCVRIDHLELGTHSDNMCDMVDKGRSFVARGARSPSAAIDNATADEVRRAYRAGGVSQRQLAVTHGVSKSTIGRIVRGEGYVPAEVTP